MYLCDLLWQQLATFFENSLILPALTSQTSLLGLWNDNANHDEPIINHFFLIFKLHVYNSRVKHRLNIMDLLINTKEIRPNTVYLPTVGKKRYIKINGTLLLRNYQLRKANNELTQIFF